MNDDFVARKDLSLFTSGSRISLIKIFLNEGLQNTIGTFDLYFRELPKTRNFLVCAGLEQVIDYLHHLRFTSSQLKWLYHSFDFSPKIMDYLKSFKFTGDVWAVPEGTIVFPNEPVIRISAPIVEAQLIEMFLINTIYLQTILASKITRFVYAANGKQVTVGFNRTYGTDAAMKSARINELFGNQNSLSLYHFKNRSNPFGAGSFHYFIMCFKKETDAFRTYLTQMQGKGFVLVDTYDSITGIKNFIHIAQELKQNGIQATGIQLDSGDLYELSKKARAMLDNEGLKEIKIFAMGNLDEWKVTQLEKKHAPIDVYAGVTEILTPSDAPTLELVYKLSELRVGKKIIPKMKTSTNKMSFPGRKQVYRIEKNSHYLYDMIGLENEKTNAKQLLIPIIKKGKLVYKLPSISQIREYYKTEMKKFDQKLFSLTRTIRYSVKISSSLRTLIKKTKREIH